MTADTPMSDRASRTEGAEVSPLAVEIATYWQDGDGGYVPGVAWEEAKGFAVYIRNPLASHIRDFPVKMSRVLALQAARAFANTLSTAMGAPVVLNWPGEKDAQTPFVVGGNTSPAALALAHCIDALTPPRGEEERDAVEMAKAALSELRDAPAAQAAPGLNIEQAAENAACLWEAALEIINSGSATSPVVQRALAEKEKDGMAALRNSVCRLAVEAEAAWNALSEDVRDEIAFDWDFCPVWLPYAIGWTDEAPKFGEEAKPQPYQAKGEAPVRMRAYDLMGMDHPSAAVFLALDFESTPPLASIVMKREHGDHGEKGPGERLTMADGSIWFHPYGGGAPVKEA